MSEIIEFKSVSESGEDLGKKVPEKFSGVLWIEDQKPDSNRLTIQGEECEVFSAGLQLIGEGGSVAPHREAEGVSEWVVPLWTLGHIPDSEWGGQYKIEGAHRPLGLIKSLSINSLVEAHFILKTTNNGNPELLILTPNDPRIYVRSLMAREMPAGKTHEAKAEAPCLYFVFKTKPVSSGYHAEPPM